MPMMMMRLLLLLPPQSLAPVCVNGVGHWWMIDGQHLMHSVMRHLMRQQVQSGMA